MGAFWQCIETLKPAAMAAVLTLVFLFPRLGEAQSSFQLPEPTVPPPETIDERGESPTYYRIVDDVVLASVRTSYGVAWRFGSESEQRNGSFSMDLAAGAEIGFGRGSRPAILFEGGYSYSYRAQHLVSLGAGLVIRRFGPTAFDDDNVGRPSGDVVVSLVPRFVLGKAGSEFAWGVHTGLLFAYSLYGVQLSYLYTHIGERDIHGIRLSLVIYWRMERP